LFRNQKLLEAVREFECALCGAEDGTVVAAHSNQLRDGKGKGIKAHDYRIAALCYRCHMAIDQGHRLNKQDKEAMWEEAHRKTIGFLFERGKLWVQ
jgi:hypothetical protein